MKKNLINILAILWSTAVFAQAPVSVQNVAPQEVQPEQTQQQNQEQAAEKPEAPQQISTPKIEPEKKSGDSSFADIAALILTVFLAAIPFLGFGKVLSLVFSPLTKANKIATKKINEARERADETDEEREIRTLTENKDGEALYKRGLECDAKDSGGGFSYYVAGDELNHPGCQYQMAMIALNVESVRSDREGTAYKMAVDRLKSASANNYLPAIEELKKLG